jgi:hypothetical protein
MTQNRDEERARRDEDRSQEAHWEIAEAAAAEGEVERAPEIRKSGNREEEWESEGGALGRET